jgi:hypothetical protein
MADTQTTPLAAENDPWNRYRHLDPALQHSVLQEQQDAQRGVVRREPAAKLKPWERNWQTPAAPADAQPKPWERDWAAPRETGTARYRVTGPDGRRYLVTAPAGATQDEILARVRAHADSQADDAPTQADAEATYPLPTGEQMRRKAGVREDDRAYYASPEGRAEVQAATGGILRQAAKGATFGAAPRLEAAFDTGFGLATPALALRATMESASMKFATPTPPMRRRIPTSHLPPALVARC